MQGFITEALLKYEIVRINNIKQLFAKYIMGFFENFVM